MNIPVFLINLNQYPNKRIKSINSLKNVGFNNIKCIDAIDGKKLKNISKMTTIYTQFLIENPLFRCSHEQLNTVGAIGCYLSHIKCWKEMLKQGYESIYIFEDDLEMVPNFADKLNTIMTNIPSDCDFLSFGYIKLNGEYKFSKSIENFKIPFFGLQGYYITAKGAHKLLQYIFPIEIQIDAYISMMNYFNIINVYFTQQILVKQNNSDDSSTNYIDCYKCYLPKKNINRRDILVFILVFLIILIFIKIKWRN